jgi:hypothetical protein
MSRIPMKASPTFLLLIAALLFVAGVFLLAGQPASVKAAPAALPPMQAADNSACLGCHGAPGQIFTFPNGDVVSISVDAEEFSQGTHAELGCSQCHTTITTYPHPEVTAQSAHEFNQQFKDACATCHQVQSRQTKDNAHDKLAQAGNPNTPTCADCHVPHGQATIENDANGDPAPSEHPKIAAICEKCHSTIVDKYKNSVHGKAVFEEGNLDVPACDDCHGVHKITPARTLEFRLNSPDLCATCHTRADIMDKYGISTDVLSTYVADFHGQVIVLFNDNAGTPTNKPVCNDCHGIHDISRVDDPEHGIAIKANLAKTCQRCHPASENVNFPDSWLNHYTPSMEKHPLVYIITLIYYILIPTVLGAMLIFVLSDVYRRLRSRGKQHPQPPADTDGKTE